ncbi:MAG: hypothetical protein M1503_08250 [Thaumarchaeota archaeon]|nr:hypothetical protein [Nitrososphaerota archaeon]MCL5318232.1 hypothetical protein [Nitrososphaerota archaeon]
MRNSPNEKLLDEKEAGRWLAEILHRKASLKIGVYGSYYPAPELRRLERLRDALKSEGYTQTYLVKNLPDLTDFRDDFDKSVFALERSNVNLFILTFKGQKQGAVRELDYVLRNPKHVFKCTVFIEKEAATSRGKLSEGKRRRCITTLLEDDLRAVNMRVAEFDQEDNNDDELLAMVRGTLLDYLYYFLRNRPEDLKEG